MSKEKQYTWNGLNRTTNSNLHDAPFQNCHELSFSNNDGTLFMKYDDCFKDENKVSTISREGFPLEHSTSLHQHIRKKAHDSKKKSFKLQFLRKKWISHKYTEAEQNCPFQDAFDPSDAISTTEYEISSSSSNPLTFNDFSVIPFEECNAIQLAVNTDCNESNKHHSDRSVIMANIKYMSKYCKKHRRDRNIGLSIDVKDSDEEKSQTNSFYKRDLSSIDYPTMTSKSKGKPELNKSHMVRRKSHKTRTKDRAIENKSQSDIDFFDMETLLSPSKYKDYRTQSRARRSEKSRRFKSKESKTHKKIKDVTLMKHNNGSFEVVGYRDIACNNRGIYDLSTQTKKSRKKWSNEIDPYIIHRERASLSRQINKKNRGPGLGIDLKNYKINNKHEYSIIEQNKVQGEKPSKALRDHFSKLGISSILNS